MHSNCKFSSKLFNQLAFFLVSFRFTEFEELAVYLKLEILQRFED